MEALNDWLQAIDRLASLMAQRGVAQIRLRGEDAQLYLRRESQAPLAPPQESMPPLFLSGYAPSAEPEAEPAESRWQPPSLFEVRSTLVGYCYLAPKTVGSRVERGEPLATIEVLGIPNEITAPMPGILEGWVVESGQAVEYGQVIALLSPLSEE